MKAVKYKPVILYCASGDKQVKEILDNEIIAPYRVMRDTGELMEYLRKPTMTTFVIIDYEGNRANSELLIVSGTELGLYALTQLHAYSEVYVLGDTEHPRSLNDKDVNDTLKYYEFI